jgi:CRP/FNR family cyclic AMP-dependent transcriptional regulator
MEAPTKLQDMPLFAGLDRDTLVDLDQVAVRRKFAKNTVLFSKGDESASVYLIAKGYVRAVISDENGREMVLNQFGPGEFFGEFAMLDGKPRSATAITLENTEVVIIRREDFERIVLSNPDVVLHLLKILLKKLREATERIESLSFLSVYERITRLLSNLAAPGENGDIIEVKLTHRDIATMVGASREMVSKIMKQLFDGGFLAREGKQIKIMKKLPRQF